MTARAALPFVTATVEIRLGGRRYAPRAFTEQGVGGLDPVPGYGVHAEGMRTHEVADRAGVNAQTLRYDERRGLLAEPPPRSPAGYRDYPVSVVASCGS